MGVESGPSGAVSVAGPAIGGLAAPVEAPFGMVIEGPVRGSLEGFRPMNIKPLGEIVFNSEPLTPEGAISQAEAIIAEARIAGNSVLPETKFSSEPSVIPRSDVVGPWESYFNEQSSSTSKIATSLVSLAPRNDNEVGDDKMVQPELRSVARQAVSPVTSGQSEAIYPQTIQEQFVQEIVKEEIKVQDRVDEPSETREQEEIEELTVKYVEDEAVTGRRKYEIREAIKKASSEAEKEGIEGIEGWRIKKYFQPEHPGIRSGITEPGTVDGSLVETYEDISDRNYDSEVQAERVADSVVADKKPVKKAKEGKKVKERDIARIRRDPFLKRHPVEEVVARIVKKSTVEAKPGQKPAEVTTALVAEESAEGKVEDYPDLAEALYQKAA